MEHYYTTIYECNYFLQRGEKKFDETIKPQRDWKGRSRFGKISESPHMASPTPWGIYKIVAFGKKLSGKAERTETTYMCAAVHHTYDELTPDAKAFLENAERAKLPPLSRDTWAERRRFVDSMARKAPAPPHSLKAIEDRLIPAEGRQLPVRIYTPHEEGPFPLLLFFHGGGWIVGSLDMEEHVCIELADRTPCIVVSVDYRLAPEHPFPAAFDDCYDSLVWLAKNGAELGGDPEKIAVGGESAGANLAAAVTLGARDRGGPKLLFQLLFNPVTDLSDFNTPSHREFASSFILTREEMEVTRSLYVAREEDYLNPYVSPLLSASLTGLPPALVVTSGFDPLRDEGEAYAGRLREAGVPARLIRHENTIHGFLYFLRNGENAKRALREAAQAMREAMSP